MNGRILARIPNSWILLACIGLLALNLRGPFVAVAPVVDLMQAELNFSPVLLGLLTSIPVLCFSLAAPLASLAARKFGAEFAVTLTILGVLAGVLVGLLAAVAGGAVGPGRMRTVEPFAFDVLVHAITAFGIGGLFGGLAMTWWQRRTAHRADHPAAGS